VILIRLLDQAIHEYAMNTPTTLGKMERWFRTYDLEHARFQLHSKFNFERPHMALDYSTPAQVYFGDVPKVLG